MNTTNVFEIILHLPHAKSLLVETVLADDASQAKEECKQRHEDIDFDKCFIDCKPVDAIGVIKKLLLFQEKAEKWDALDEKISAFYLDKNGDELEDEEGGDLCDIGEVSARAFGFM